MFLFTVLSQYEKDFNFKLISGLNSNDESGEWRVTGTSSIVPLVRERESWRGEQLYRLQSSYQHRKYLETKVYTTH